MKTCKTVALVLAFSASLALSQKPSGGSDQPYLSRDLNYATINLSKVKKNMLWSLRAENDGVVASTLGNIAHLRIMLPQADLKDLVNAVKLLSGSGNTSTIRYKASLVCLVFDNPGMFESSLARAYMSDDEFFAEIDSIARQHFLSYSAR